jgi:hypothetical protein
MWKNLNTFVYQKKLAFIIKYVQDRRTTKITDDFNNILEDIDFELFGSGFRTSDVNKFMDERSYDYRDSYDDEAYDDEELLDDYESARQHMTDLATDEFIEQFK